MTSEINLFRVIKNLPSRERSFYLMMQAYKRDLVKCHNSDSADLVSSIYEDEIIKILSAPCEDNLFDIKRNLNVVPAKPPIAESHEDQQDKAEVSVVKSDKLFDKKLGNWASSFSDNEDELRDNLTKRLSNDSDLSSNDD